MSSTYYDELLAIAARIMELEVVEEQLDPRDWKEAKQEYDGLEELFGKRRDEFVDALLTEENDRSTIAEEVIAELDQIAAQSDPGWQPAVEYVRNKLIPNLEREARKSPLRRRIVKWTPVAIGTVLVIAYFVVRLTSGVSIDHPLASEEGLKERAAAFQKVARYDDWNSTRVRRGAWAMVILLWPIEPTDREIEGAAEFVSAILETHAALVRNGWACGYLQRGAGSSLSDQEIELVADLAVYVRSDDMIWTDPIEASLISPIQTAFPCN